MKNVKNTIDAIFRNKTKALVPYITAGDPTMEKSLQLLDFLASNNATMIEIGVPFSDPMADGEVVQRAMSRALGFSLENTFQLIEKFRENHQTPLILMGYLNTFNSYGFEKLTKKMNELKIDGIIIVDLPLEEVDKLSNIFEEQNIHIIPLISPLTSIERLNIMKQYYSGFAYLISVTGTTGIRNELPEDIKTKAQIVKNQMQLPVLLGFGVSKPEIIEKFKNEVDGFIIGSALIRAWEEDNFTVGEHVTNFWKSMVEKI
ncbi:tryptophan synthase subunit alpha [Fervidobacterium pennivorans subsp. carthaginiensis]|uniref:tryptophan synthase subunit alpha n=1 Tax=Fervidobacterium pennivorans TaxID=93466 RepID=UPI00355C58B4